MGEPDTHLLAYLAGAIDADGYVYVKRTGWNRHTRRAFWNMHYDGRIGLTQTTTVVQDLLRGAFGGYVYGSHPAEGNRKRTFRWIATDRRAVDACVALLPYLRIKAEQARRVVELGETNAPEWRRFATWFAREHPDWPTMELVSVEEAMRLLGYVNRGGVHQAIYARTLLATPFDKNPGAPRIPRAMVESLAALRAGHGSFQVRPPQLTAWRERLYQEVRELNKPGTNGTPAYRREGLYAENLALAAHDAHPTSSAMTRERAAST